MGGKKPTAAVAVMVAVVAGAMWLQLTSAGAAGVATVSDPTTELAAGTVAPGDSADAGSTGSAVVPRAPFDRAQHSTSGPESIWVIVNKRHPIEPPDFRPQLTLVRGYQVAVPAAAPLARLLAATDAQGFDFKIASGFRSYGYQERVYGQLVATSGRAAADRVSARPGYSEHQTGLAVDLVSLTRTGCNFEACFAGTPGGRWLARNVWRYGFLIRYQPGTADVTGYSPEPWHLRYVGRPLAAELRRSHVPTLEEFFGVRGGDYRS